MNQARLPHAIENEARANTQAHPPTEAQQLHDARTANALLRERLQEQEAIAAKERGRADNAMLQIRDASNALHQAGIDAEPHEAHEGCATQLGHRVRALAEHARSVDATNDTMAAEHAALLLSDHAPAALLRADLSSRYAALLAAVEGVVAVGYTDGLVMVSRAAFERLKGAI